MMIMMITKMMMLIIIIVIIIIVIIFIVIMFIMMMTDDVDDVDDLPANDDDDGDDGDGDDNSRAVLSDPNCDGSKWSKSRGSKRAPDPHVYDCKYIVGASLKVIHWLTTMFPMKSGNRNQVLGAACTVGLVLLAQVGGVPSKEQLPTYSVVSVITITITHHHHRRQEQ